MQKLNNITDKEMGPENIYVIKEHSLTFWGLPVFLHRLVHWQYVSVPQDRRYGIPKFIFIIILTNNNPIIYKGRLESSWTGSSVRHTNITAAHCHQSMNL